MKTLGEEQLDKLKEIVEELGDHVSLIMGKLENVYESILAMQTKIGIDKSEDESSLDYKITDLTERLEILEGDNENNPT